MTTRAEEVPGALACSLMNPLNVGDSAPDFTLPDQHGEPVSLSSFSGQTVVLYFYPKADTPGCKSSN